MKATDRSRISVVPVAKVAKKARMIATRNNSSKPTAVLMFMLRCHSSGSSEHSTES